MPLALWALVSLVLSLTAGCSNVGESRSSVPAAPALSIEPVTDGLAAHRPAVAGVNGLVTAGHPLAAEAGLRVLQQGGLAMDAAITAARRAFDETDWSTDADFRRHCLTQLGDALAEEIETFRTILVSEAGAPVSLTEWYQLDPLVGDLGYWRDQIAAAIEQHRDDRAGARVA